MQTLSPSIDDAAGRANVWVPFLLCVAAFVADFLTPLGLADGFTYVIAVMACIRVRDPKWVLYVAGIATALLTAGLWLAHWDEIDQDPLAEVNRALGVVTMWIVAALVWRNLRAEAALRASRGEAEQASQTKSRFLAVASHDLRQPLQTARLLSSTLVRKCEDPAIRDIVEQQQRALGSATRMLNTLLDLNKLESGSLEPAIDTVDLASLFAQLREELADQAAQKDVRLRADPGGLFVRSDRQWLRQILQNLLTNALRFTPAGGEVVVAAQVQADEVSIEVRDTGFGISPDQIEHVFDEFYKVDSPTGGTREGWGLGLSIVRHAAAMLGHRIDVQSEIGRGTTFTLTLPGAPSRPGEVEADGRSEGVPGTGGGRHVLLVDDDAAVVAATSLWLGTEGFEVDTALGGADVERLLTTPGFSPELIVSDLHLGAGQSGIDVVRTVRERLHRTVPAIFVSGETQPTMFEAEALERVRFMIKPVEPHELLRAMQALADDGTDSRDA